MDIRFYFSLLLVTAGLLAVSGQRRPSKSEQFYQSVSMAISQGVSRQAPPREDDKDPIQVGFEFSLTAVTDLNKKKGYAELEGFLTMSWEDPRLRFYQGAPDEEVNSVRVDPKSIWTPDLDLFNSVQPGLQVVNRYTTAIISASGHVVLVNKFRTRSICDVFGQLSRSNVANCTMKFGSWAYNGNDIQPTLSSGPAQLLDKFKAHSLWNATAATAWVGQDFYDCCPEPYPWVKVSFHLKKRARG